MTSWCPGTGTRTRGGSRTCNAYGRHEASGPLGKLHLPTGRVSFEAVVRCLISDWGVTPARDDWREVLDDTERRFLAYRTWHSDAPDD